MELLKYNFEVGIIKELYHRNLISNDELQSILQILEIIKKQEMKENATC